MTKKVVLIDNLIRNKPIREVTLNKEYKVVSENEKCYIILNDLGDKHSLNKTRFKQ